MQVADSGRSHPEIGTGASLWLYGPEEVIPSFAFSRYEVELNQQDSSTALAARLGILEP
jgi:hypothetical protein